MYTDAAVSVKEKGSVLTCSVFAIYLLFGLPSGIWDWTCLALIWASVCLLCTFVQLLWRKNHYNRLVNLSSCRGFLRRKIKGFCPSLPVSLRSMACCSCALAAQEHGPGWKSCCSAIWTAVAPLSKALRLRFVPSCLLESICSLKTPQTAAHRSGRHF